MTVEELQIIISAKTESVHAKIDKLKEKIASVQPKKAAEVNVTTDRAQGNLKKLQAELSRTQAKIQKLAEKQNAVQSQIEARAGMYSDVPNLSGMGHEETVGTLMDSDLQVQALSAQLGELDAETAPLKAHLAETKSRIASVGSASASTAEKTGGFGQKMKSAGNSIKRAGDHAGYFSRRLKAVVSGLILYRGIAFIFQSITQGLQNMAQGNAQANSTMSRLATSALYLKNSIAASLMPALQALTPIINQVADALANVFNTISMLSARIFNHSQTAVIAQRANVNYAETLSGVGDKAKDAAKQVKELQHTVMGFDELNLLSKPLDSTGGTGSNGAGGKAGMPSYGSMFKTVKVPGWVNKIGQITDKIKKMVQDNIDAIQRMLRLAPLVVGAILAFSGHPALGIALMAAGAVLMAKQAKLDWNYLTDKTKSSLDKTKRLLEIVGAVELAVGAVIAFSGANLGLGIALMIGGITTTAATLNWDSLGKNVKSAVGGITFGSAAAMLVLGAVLAFSGAHIALGIGLLIAGATTMWASATLNWNDMDSRLKTKIGIYTAIASGALFALGVILVCTGHIPLGVGMIIAGSIGIASAAALNWNSVETSIKVALTSILAIASVASVAIGLLLCLTGAGIPIGIGLILAGIKGASYAKSISTNPITNWARDLINSVISIVETGVNWVILKLNTISYTVPDWVAGIGGKTFGININPIYIPRVVADTQRPMKGSGRNVYSFASGALVTGPVPAIVGEGVDHEAVLPLNDDVYSRIGKGIAEHGNASESAGNTDQVINHLDRLETAIREMKVVLYSSDRKIAESANRGNASIDRRYHPIARA